MAEAQVVDQQEPQATPPQEFEPAPPEGGEEQFASPEEQMYAEEHERRAALERGEVLPLEQEPEPVVEPPPPESPHVGTSEPAPVAAAPVDEKPEWYENLSDVAKSAFDQQQRDISQLQWQYSAVHGRLAPVQAQVESLTRRLSQGQPAPQATPGGQPAPMSPTPAPMMAPDFDSEEFKEFAATYPDEAAQMKRVSLAQQSQVAHLQGQVDRLTQGLDRVQQASTAQTHATEVQTLAERHPDWMQVRNSPDFLKWLEYQPSTIQPMVDSARSADCIYILDRYKQDVQLFNLQHGANGAAQPAPPAPPSRGTQTMQHRQTLVSTPTPDPQGGGVGVPGVSGPPQTAEQLWVTEVDRRLRAQRNQR